MGKATKRAASPPQERERGPKRPRAKAESDSGSEAEDEYSDTEDLQGQVVQLDRLDRNLNLMLRRVRSTLKSARKSEVLRAIKRLQAAKGRDHSAGSKKAQEKGAQDVDILTKELDITKHVPLDMLAHRVVGRKLVRSRLLPKVKLLPTSDKKDYPLLATAKAQPGGEVHTALLAEASGELEERVYERFTSTKTVAAAASAGVEKLETLLSEAKGTTAPPSDQKSKDKTSSKCPESAPPEQSAEEEEDQEETPEGQQGEMPEFGQEWDALVGSGSEGEGDEDEGDGPLPESDYSDIEAEGSEEGSGEADKHRKHGEPLDAEPEGSDEAENLEEDSADDSEEDSEDSDGSEGGLPSLAAGYVERGVRLSGKGDASDYSDDEMEVEAPVRKNRMGQRARRALWEKKFGRSAKHVQAEAKKREEHRPQRGRGRDKPVPRMGTSSNDTPLGPRAKPVDTPKHKPKQKGEPKEDKPMHPSWVAKQQQKKQAEAKPQGKKVVFE